MATIDHGRARLILSCLVLGIVVAACGGSAPQAKTTGPLRPSQILSAPAGLIAGGAPQADGTLWLLAGSTEAKTLQRLNLVTGRVMQIVPVGADADSLVESSTGLLAVGYANVSGSVEFRNGSSGALLGAVTVDAPVKAIGSGNGTTFYVLSGTSTESSVNVVSSIGAAEPPSLGVALNTIALAVGPNDDQLYLLESSGSVVDTPLSAKAGQKLASAGFFVGRSPVQLALSGDGSTLFVLKGIQSDMNVGVFNTQTEQQLDVLPAPANSVGVLVSIDVTHIYVLVGTPTLGNLQVYPVGR
jgi:hypothetical protein